MPAPDARNENAWRFPWALPALLYGAFICYGSLVPFGFELHSFDLIRRYYLHIGPDSPKGRSPGDALLNVVLYAPLAFAWFGAVRREMRPGLNAALAAGVLAGCVALSLAMEFLQLFLAQRTSSWRDLLANAAGAAAGLACWRVAGTRATAVLTGLTAPRALPGNAVIARGAALGLLAYLPVMAAAYGWFARDWLGLGAAIERAAAAHWLPFYYPYGVEIATLVIRSLLIAALYAPAGALWAGWWLRIARPRSCGILLSALGAFVLLGAVLESSTLFLGGAQPDLLSVVAGALGAGAGWIAACRLAALAGERAGLPREVASDRPV